MTGQRSFRRLPAPDMPDMLTPQARRADAPMLDLRPCASLRRRGAPMLDLDARNAASRARDGWPGTARPGDGNPDALPPDAPRRRPPLIDCHPAHASRTWAQTFASFGFVKVSDPIGGHVARIAAQQVARTTARIARQAAKATRADGQIVQRAAAQSLTQNATQNARRAQIQTARVVAQACAARSPDRTDCRASHPARAAQPMSATAQAVQRAAPVTQTAAPRTRAGAAAAQGARPSARAVAHAQARPARVAANRPQNPNPIA